MNNVFRGNRAAASGALVAGTGGAAKVVLFRGNLVVDNSAGAGPGAVELLGNGGSYVQVYGNTIAQNTVDNTDTGSLDCAYNADCDVANNVLWNNDNSDLDLRSSTASLRYNDIGTRVGNTVPSVDVGNASVDPAFVDPTSGNFHLAGDSPVLGTSPLPLGMLDVEGHAYPATGLQDLGTYAETIFTDPFDP